MGVGPRWSGTLGDAESGRTGAFDLAGWLSVVIGSRCERGPEEEAALRVLVNSPPGTLCRDRWWDAVMSPESERFGRARHRLNLWVPR